MKKVLFLFAFICTCFSVSAQCPGPVKRIALNALQKAGIVESTRAGQIPLTDACGNQRYAQYTEINPTPIGYTPTLTGNTNNISEFVTTASGDIWYIDWQGRATKLYVSAQAGDYDWLEIQNNQIPNSITDSIYKYRYAAIGGRLVWPTAELLVVDSAAQGMFVVSGNRKAKIALYDNDNLTWSTM